MHLLTETLINQMDYTMVITGNSRLKLSLKGTPATLLKMFSLVVEGKLYVFYSCIISEMSQSKN